MDHAITIGDLVRWTLWVGGGCAIAGVIGYIVLVVMNPFRSGH